MRSTRKLKVLGLVALLIGFGIALQNVSRADSLTTNDPSGDATGGTAPAIDITSVSHSDTGAAITYSAHAASTFDNTADFFQMRWDLDLDNDGTFGVGSNDACILLEQDGNGGIQAELKKSCTGSASITQAVTTAAPAGGGEDLTFSFDNQGFRTATGFTGTSYRYKVTSSDAHGNVDHVPDTTANPNFITHSNVAPAATPTPVPTATPTPVPTLPPGATQSSSQQSQQLNVDGVLSISALQSLINFGHLSTGGSVTGVGAGEIDYTNTLNNGAAWQVTVQATSLKGGPSGGDIIPFSNETYVPGTTIGPTSGSTGAPTAGSTSQGAFVGTDTTPGTTFSNPITVATAAPGVAQGSYRQTGGSVGLNVPLATKPGFYTGKIQYTITG